MKTYHLKQVKINPKKSEFWKKQTEIKKEFNRFHRGLHCSDVYVREKLGAWTTRRLRPFEFPIAYLYVLIGDFGVIIIIMIIIYFYSLGSVTDRNVFHLTNLLKKLPCVHNTMTRDCPDSDSGFL